MLRKYLPASITALGVILALSTLLFINPNNSLVYSAASHVVISEIQLSAGTGLSTSEFVELYNPTGTSVDLTNWKVSKKNQANTTEDFLVSNLNGTIPAHGYFLIGSEAYQSTATVSADATYATDSASLTDDNTIVIYDNADAVVDKVGLGSATDFESDAEPNPASGSSRERKALSTSTSTDMSVGGTDEFLGNGEDTDNNDNDFNLRTIPQPQNTQSDLEPVEATATPSATPTDSTTPTATPEETLGREIIEGAKDVKIEDMQVHINAHVRKSSGMSAHADQPKLLKWIKQVKDAKKVYLIHGENPQRQTLAGLIKSQVGIKDVVMPNLNQVESLG